jgi:hypothetical protein
MKNRFAFAFALLLMGAGAAFGASSVISPAGDGVSGVGMVPLSGAPAAGVTIHVDNVARTLQALVENEGGTWLSGGTAPIGVLLTCRSKDISIYFGGSTPTASVGVPLVAGQAWQILGPTWVSTMKAISATADNVACPTHLIR